MLAFHLLGKRWLLSLTSLPPGETRVREQAAEIPFFRSLLAPGVQAESHIKKVLRRTPILMFFRAPFILFHFAF